MGGSSLVRRLGVLVSLLVAGCGGGGTGAPAGVPEAGSERAPPPSAIPRAGDESATVLDAAGRHWVDSTLASLSLRERAAQLVFPWITGAYAATTSPEFRELAALVDEMQVGGLLISIGTPHAYAAKLNELQRRAPVPLLVTSDFENGGPGMRINHSYALPSLIPQGGGTSFPPTMAFGAIGDARFAREYGRITAEEARAVGVHLNFAPVLDVNSNPENPVINTRSFGEDPERVAELGTAFIRGSHKGGVMATAKHFPGHGDTRTDSHLELPAVPADRARLDSVELVPFRAALEAGVDAVMTAHVVVTGLEGPGAPPATLSPALMEGVLRNELGFRGLLFTDALRMDAITEGWGGGEAAVLALEAGADAILAPADPEEALAALVAAVRSGRVADSRLDRSVRKILEAKARMGLHRRRTVSLADVDQKVGTGPHRAFADTAATRSITLVRDRRGLVPLAGRDEGKVLSVSYTRPDDLLAGRTFDGALVRGRPGMRPTVRSARLDAAAPEVALEALDRAADSADLVVVGVYVPPVSGSGSVAVDTAFADFVGRLAERRPTVVVSFGSPYVLDAFPFVGSYMLAWGDREVSQEAAARALLGRAAITGTLPISIPPYHEVGEGLHRDRLEDGADGTGVPVSPLEAPPEVVGVSAEGLAELDSLILAAVADSASPGVALALGYRGRLLRLRGYGRLDWAEDAPPATPSSLWDLASLTKVVGTTTAVMILVDRGRLDLDAPVVRYLPWWSGGRPGKERVTVRQLLLHRAGLPDFRRFFLESEGREAFEKALADLALEFRPGDRTSYSDIGLMTAGFVVEAVTGEALDDFLHREVWRPLGMQDTRYRPSLWERIRVAPTEVDTFYRMEQVHGVVHDENAYALGGVAGHAGLFSSARDLAVFAQMLLDGGFAGPCRPEPDSGRPCSRPRHEAVRLADPGAVARFTARWDETASRALGWDTSDLAGDSPSTGGESKGPAFGHTGFTGTSLWVDPSRELFVVLLTNRLNPSRENLKHLPLRRAVHDLAVELVDRASPVTEGERSVRR